MENILLCGAAKALITPPKELLPDLFGLMLSGFDSIHDELYVRVIALQSGEKQMLLVGYDLDKGPHPVEYTKALEEETGIPAEHMLYFGIHAHAVPITGYRPFEGRNDITKKPEPVQKAVHAYEAILLRQLLQAAREAVDSMRPAKYGYAFGKSYINVKRAYPYVERSRRAEDIPVGEASGEQGKNTETGFAKDMMDKKTNSSSANRGMDDRACPKEIPSDVKTGQSCAGRNRSTDVFLAEGWINDESVDRTLFVMRFEDMQGAPIAFLMNYPMHNVSMFLNDAGNGKMAISSDIGGTVSKYMEEEFPGAVAMWSSGAAGDINSIFTPTLNYPDPKTGAMTHNTLLKLEYTSAMMEYMASLHFQDVLNVNRCISGLSGQAALACATDYSRTPASSDVMTKVNYTLDEGKTYNIRLRLAQIGEVALVGVDGELYSSHGAAVKAASPAKATVLITHESSLLLDNPAYILDDEAILTIQQRGEGGMPGWTQFTGVPYMIAPSLQKCVRRLFEEAK